MPYVSTGQARNPAENPPTSAPRSKFVAARGELIPGPILRIGNTNTRLRFGVMSPDEFGQACLPARQAWTETGCTHHFALGLGQQLGKIEKLARLLGTEPDVGGR